MLPITVKLLLVIAGALLTVVSITNKTYEIRHDSAGNKHWRPTSAGRLAIFLAILMVTLGVTNELFERRSQQALEREISSLNIALDRRDHDLEEMRSIIERQIRDARSRAELVNAVLERSETVAASASIRIERPQYRNIQGEDNQPITPLPGEWLEWGISCTEGLDFLSNPPHDRCDRPIFGYFVAHQQPIPMPIQSPAGTAAVQSNRGPATPLGVQFADGQCS